MSMMGGDKQGQTIVYHLVELLKTRNRLPQPMGCPSEVPLFTIQCHLIQIIILTSNIQCRKIYSQTLSKCIVHIEC